MAIRRLTSDLMSRSRLAVRSPFLKNFSDFVSLQCYGVQVLLFDDETDGQTDEAKEKHQQHCTLILCFEEEAWQSDLDSFKCLGAIRVPILLPVIVLAGISEYLVCLHD